MSWKQHIVLVQRRVTAGFAQVNTSGFGGGVSSAVSGEGSTAYAGVQTPNGRRLFMGYRRSAQGSAAFLGVRYPGVEFLPLLHHILDPATPQAARRLGYEMRDTVYAISAAGANEFAWGLIGSVAVNYPNGLVGIGFRWGSDFSIKTFVRDGAASPTTLVRETATGILASSPRQLLLRINSWERRIEWYIDSVLVDSYVPAVALGQVSSAANNLDLDCRYRAFVPISGDASIMFMGEGEAVPLLSLCEFSPNTPPGPLGVASTWTGEPPGP